MQEGAPAFAPDAAQASRNSRNSAAILRGLPLRAIIATIQMGCGVRAPGGPSLLGDGVMVTRQTLDLLIQVRILVSQPIPNSLRDVVVYACQFLDGRMGVFGD